MPLRVIALAGTLFGIWGTPGVPAARVAATQPPAVASLRHPVAGLYRDVGGAEFTVMDLSDQTAGRTTLALVRMSDGWARILATSGTGWSYGGSWPAPTPSVGHLRVVEFRGAEVTALIDSSETGSRRLTRVALHEEEFTWRSRDLSLHGTLVSPAAAGRYPAIVMIAGSGPLTRRSTRYTADWLAAKGFTVLAYDKPGAGRSEGPPGVLGHADWAADVRSAVQKFAAHPRVDTSRLGLVAGSEGGFIAPRVAAADSRIAFVLCRVCSARPHLEAVLDQEETRLRKASASAGEWLAASEWLRARGEAALGLRAKSTVAEIEARSLAAGATWRRHYTAQQLTTHPNTAPFWDAYRAVLEGEPAELYPARALDVLYLLGGDDDRVIARKQDSALRRIDERVEGRLEVRILPCADHSLLLTCGPGSAHGFHPAVHATMLEWLLRVTSAAAPSGRAGPPSELPVRRGPGPSYGRRR